jgi:simple sugar transport system ATP-binding protein
VTEHLKCADYGPTPSISAGPVLQAVNISKSFPGVLANDQVNFELAKGEIHALLGENGSGKTTFSKMLAGLYTPDSGTIYIDGQPTALPLPRHAHAAGIFLIQQNFSLVERLTVAENIVLGLKEASLSRRKYKALVARIEEDGRRYGLDVEPSAYIWQLSMGERQRVEIIKALYRRARILILDEPTTVLTPQEWHRRTPQSSSSRTSSPRSSPCATG